MAEIKALPNEAPPAPPKSIKVGVSVINAIHRLCQQSEAVNTGCKATLEALGLTAPEDTYSLVIEARLERQKGE